jgi:hypothetical protein
MNDVNIAKNPLLDNYNSNDVNLTSVLPEIEISSLNISVFKNNILEVNELINKAIELNKSLKEITDSDTERNSITLDIETLTLRINQNLDQQENLNKNLSHNYDLSKQNKLNTPHKLNDSVDDIQKNTTISNIESEKSDVDILESDNSVVNDSESDSAIAEQINTSTKNQLENSIVENNKQNNLTNIIATSFNEKVKKSFNEFIKSTTLKIHKLFRFKQKLSAVPSENDIADLVLNDLGKVVHDETIYTNNPAK